MLSKTLSTLLLLLLLATLTTAHMHMDSPTPFNYDRLKQENAAILSAASFPCNPTNEAAFTPFGDNPMKVGEVQKLKISGAGGAGAPHGGGSCQLSISTDTVPSASSDWKVIKSFIGGCPDKDSKTGSEFEFTLPPEVPNGNVTLAWTWLAHVTGELYMNCAPLTVTGGADDASGLEKLPDVFVASKNVAEMQCTWGNGEVGEGDIEFPNPGKDVTRAEVVQAVKPEGAGCGKPFKGSGKAVAAPPASSAGGVYTAATSTASTPTSAIGGVFAPNAASAQNPQPTTLVAVTSSLIAPESPAETADALAGIVGTAAAALGTGTPCPTNGAIVCNGANQFGTCNFGKVAVWQNVAAGMKCQDGKYVRAELKLHRRGRITRSRFGHSHF